MIIDINHTLPAPQGYRTALVQSYFNVEDPSFKLQTELPLHAKPWQIGLVVGPSGSGKTSIGKKLFDGRGFSNFSWPDLPIIEAICPEQPFDRVSQALVNVGLGTVPAWLRPYAALSTGEQFRANLARIVCERPASVVIDEFTSVVGRQVAKVGACAFARAWRKGAGQAVLLSCHYDIVPWLQADWVFDTGSGQFSWGCLRPRPKVRLEIRQTNWLYWPDFEAHHYLKLPRPIAAWAYVGFIGGVPVAHVAFSTRPGCFEARACRLVVLPEWQGLGIGLKFLNAVADLWRRGENYYNKPMRTTIATSHPGLITALRQHEYWTQTGAVLYGQNKSISQASIRSSAKTASRASIATGYGGHFRPIQSFRYLGEEANKI